MDRSEAEYYKEAVEALEEHEPDTFALSLVDDDERARTIHRDGRATGTVHLIGAMVHTLAKATGEKPEKIALLSWKAFAEMLGGVQHFQDEYIE